MTQHTPGQWVLDDADDDLTIIGGHNLGDAVLVAKVDGITWPVPSDEARANAEYIVRACNSHADLLAACKSALESLKWHVFQDAALGDCAPDDIVGHGILLLLTEAIAKAEGAQVPA